MVAGQNGTPYRAARSASQWLVTPITAQWQAIWHNNKMKLVGSDTNMLKVSSKLKKSLVTAGTVERFPAKTVLFEVDEENRGVYLILKGKVRLTVKDFHKLDRTFSAGSLLGVPATYTGHTYSLAAEAVTDAEVLHVERKPFLDLMSEQPDLCRETTDMLSREVSFIQAAVAERRRQKAVAV
jgi:CRP-like cAMP-binding protein